MSQGGYTTTGTTIATITKAITLSGGYTTSDWDTAQPELYPTVLDAENVSGRRGIYVDVSRTTNVVVEGLTVQNGYIPNSAVEAGSGGGIYITNGTVMLRELVVRDSRVDHKGRYPGAQWRRYCRSLHDRT